MPLKNTIRQSRMQPTSSRFVPSADAGEMLITWSEWDDPDGMAEYDGCPLAHVISDDVHNRRKAASCLISQEFSSEDGEPANRLSGLVYFEKRTDSLVPHLSNEVFQHIEWVY